MKRYFLTLLTIVWSLSCLGAETSSPSSLSYNPPSILFLFSYHPGHDWEDSLLRALLEDLSRELPGSEMHLEYMDTKRHSLEDRIPLINHRLSDYEFDAFDIIIAADDNALKYISGEGVGFFPGTPVVFCGINDYGPFRDTMTREATGVLSQANLADTLAFALKLMPYLKTFHIVSDDTVTGRGYRQSVEGQIERLRGVLAGLNYEFLPNEKLTTEGLLEWSSSLEKDEAIILTSWFVDSRGVHISEEDFLKSLARDTAVPVLNLSNKRSGILGGKVYDGDMTAEVLTEQIVEILSGTRASEIPVVEDDLGRYFVDRERLEYWKLDADDLPLNTVFIDSNELAFNPVYRNLLIISYFIFTLLLLTLFWAGLTLKRVKRDGSRDKQQLEAVLDSVEDAVFGIDGSSNVLFLNRQAARLIKKERSLVLGQRVSESLTLVNSLDGSTLPDLSPRILAGERLSLRDGNTLVVDRMGKRIPVYYSAAAVGSGEDIETAVIVLQDISYSEKIQETLFNEQRRLRDAQAMAMVGNWEYDPEEDSYWYSKEVFALTGLDPLSSGSLETLDFMKHIYPGWKRANPLPADIRKESARVKSLMTVPRDEENNLILHLMARPAKNPETGKLIITGIIQDFSELSETRAALKASQEQLRQAARMEAVGKLAGGIAHEFNNLLQIILGYGQLLAEDLKDGTGADYVEPILKTAASARNLTRQLLLFSRKENLDKAVFSMASLVHSLTPILSRLLEENILLKSNLEGKEDWVTADRQQIEQVLINLCLNARDAMGEGGILTLEQDVIHSIRPFPGIEGAIPPGDYVHVSVRDSGSGIEENVLPQIFDPFFTTKEMEKGTGLGLAIVYGIIRQHQGYLNVETNRGAGSVFHLYLPRTEAPPEEQKPSLADRATRQSGEGLVMMAEDDPMVRQLTETMLRNNGFTVKAFVNGAELCQSLESAGGPEEQPDLFLLDVIMPRMGGVEAFHKLRTIGYDAPVLFMSGYTEDKLENMPQLEHVALIRKPFTIKDLMEEIVQLMGTKREQ